MAQEGTTTKLKSDIRLMDNWNLLKNMLIEEKVLSQKQAVSTVEKTVIFNAVDRLLSRTKIEKALNIFACGDTGEGVGFVSPHLYILVSELVNEHGDRVEGVVGGALGGTGHPEVAQGLVLLGRVLARRLVEETIEKDPID